MKTTFHILLIAALLGTPLWAQQADSEEEVVTQTILTDLKQGLEEAKLQYKGGIASYLEVLAAEERLLRAIITLGDKSEENVKRLQDIYNQCIELAQISNDKKAELETRIKLLNLSGTAESHEAALSCYGQLHEYLLEKYNQGIGDYLAVLYAEINYLKASLSGLSAEEKEEVEQQIMKKEAELERYVESLCGKRGSCFGH